MTFVLVFTCSWNETGLVSGVGSESTEIEGEIEGETGGETERECKGEARRLEEVGFILALLYVCGDI